MVSRDSRPSSRVVGAWLHTYYCDRRVMASDIPSATVLAVRRSWKFAAICQFLFTFDVALALDGFHTQVRHSTFSTCSNISVLKRR